MVMAERFNKAVLKIIDMMSHPFFIVQQDFDVKCTCVTDTTVHADPACPRCLGTGFKIKIREIDGASQDTDIPAAMRAGMEIIIARNYYVPAKWGGFKKDNIIVDGDKVLFVYQPWEGRSFKNELVYHKLISITKKLDTKVFLQNFNAIVGR